MLVGLHDTCDCFIISGGASSENSPGPRKVLKILILACAFIGAYLGVGEGLRMHPRGVCRRSHLNPFAINHLNPLLHFVNLILINN